MNKAVAGFRPERPRTGPRDPVALAVSGRNRIQTLGQLLSIAVLFVVARRIYGFNFAYEVRQLPVSPSFWSVFLLSYCITPLAEWFIYRRIWSIPVTGFFALLRKQISNELLFNYLGEAHFYTWARQRVGLKTAPFGAIKDTAILSAICGSLITLAMLPLVGPLMQALSIGFSPRLMRLSALLIMVSLAVPLMLWPRIFSLSRDLLWFIARVHMVRIVAIMLLWACIWHMALPDVAAGWWLLLAAVRQFVSRLPMATSKDLMFVAVAGFFLGRQARIADLLAMLGGLTLAVHLALGAIMGCGELIAARRQPW